MDKQEWHNEIVTKLLYKSTATEADSLRFILDELQMRREVEEYGRKLRVVIYTALGDYFIYDDKGIKDRYTLPELHTKLKELTNET